MTARKLGILISLNLLLPKIVYASNMEVDSGNMLLGLVKFIVYIFLFILVIFLSLYGTKYIAKNFNRLASSKYIENIDAISLSNNTQVNLIKVDKYIYIVLSGEGKGVVIDKILEEDFNYREFNIDRDEGVFKHSLIEGIKKLRNKGRQNEKDN